MNTPDATRPNLLKTREYTDYNGYLRSVPGQDISAGNQILPMPCEAEKHTPERKAEIYSKELNAMVRITYRLAKHKHHKTITWSWVANWADMVDGDRSEASNNDGGVSHPSNPTPTKQDSPSKAP